MDDLADRGQRGGAAVGADDAGGLGGRGQAPLEEVLDGLDVVASLGLDGAELGDLLGPEVLNDAAQVGLLRLIQARGAGQDAAAGDPDELLDLNLQAGSVERGLGEVVDQRGGDGAVAAVQGAQGNGGGDEKRGRPCRLLWQVAADLCERSRRGGDEDGLRGGLAPGW